MLINTEKPYVINTYVLYKFFKNKNKSKCVLALYSRLININLQMGLFKLQKATRLDVQMLLSLHCRQNN